MPAATKARPAPVPPAPDFLADLAVHSLVEEALLTPKPGLVDRRGPGAHDDLSLDLMLRSAESLRTTFVDAASACAGARVDQNLRESLGAIGRDGEAAMLAETGGVNAHRGAVWTLGLLVAGAALTNGGDDDEPVATIAARIARLPDPHGVPLGTNGARVRDAYGVVGATGEARSGFPRVVGVALPALWAGRESGHDQDVVRLDALVGIMAVLNDTCLLHRGGWPGLRLVRRGAASVLEVGGASTPEGRQALAALDREMLARSLSPGGSADLLSAAIFLDALKKKETDNRKGRSWRT